MPLDAQDVEGSYFVTVAHLLQDGIFARYIIAPEANEEIAEAPRDLVSSSCLYVYVL